MPAPDPAAHRVIALLSGGLDSSVALADVLARGATVVEALTFDYGQRAAQREIQAARLISEHYGLKHRVHELPWLAQLLPRAMSAQEPPVAQPENPEELMAVERVWVPNRNGVLLNIAAAFAEARGAGVVIFGANAEEGASFPDNTPEFRERLNAALAYSTLAGVRVETPVGHLDKPGILERGIALKLPFIYVWSCYEDGAMQCGRCPSCLRILAARERLGQNAEMIFRG